MSIVAALQAAAGGGGQFLNTTQIAAAVKPLVTAANLKVIESFLNPYKASHEFRPQAGAFANYSALLNASAARFNGTIVQNNADDRVKLFIDVMSAVGKIVENVDVIVRYGTAEKHNSYNNIAEKFVKDHFVTNAKQGGTWARSRFVDGILVSTAIDSDKYGSELDTEMGKINKAEICAAVEAYLKRFMSWNPVDSTVNSICYASKVRIVARTYTPNSPKGTQLSGYLLYAVQPNRDKDGHYLIYHFEDIIADKDNPGPGWKRIGAASVLNKVDVGKGRTLVEENWPYVYYKE